MHPEDNASDEDLKAYEAQCEAWDERRNAQREENKIVAHKMSLKRNAEEDIIKAADIDDSEDEDTPNGKKRKITKPRWLQRADERQQKLMASKE